jgi:PAS domain S-box-containing protein
MTHSYDAGFVLLSVIVAMIASYAALDLAGRVRSESGTTRMGWLAGGGAVMGLGIWSMHFVGMLAFHLPVPIAYDLPLMLLSVAVAIGASLLALRVISQATLGVRTLVPAGMLMGVAIAGMHYLGMASLRADAHLSYVPSVVALSVVIAIVASLAALWLAFRFRSDVTAKGMLLKILSAVVMGVAISGMHYTAMGAARFIPSQRLPRPGHFILASSELGGAVVVSTLLIIVLALIGALIDRKLQVRSAATRQLVDETVQLGKSEQQYRLLFDHNPNPMWVYTRSTRAFLAVNQAAIARYGYNRKEFLSMTLNDLRVWSDKSPVEAITFDTGASTDSWNGRHKKKDGTLISVEGTSQAILFDGQESRLALALDVTDRRQAEEALRQSEQRTRLIIDTALDAVVTMDANGHITDWNTQAEKLFGWARTEVVGQRMADTIIPVRYREAHVEGLKRFLKSGVGRVLGKRIEMSALKRDGVEIPVELAISPAWLGAEWTFSAFIRDLTEQKKTAAALQLGEQRYRALFEDIPVGLYRSTPEGRLIEANPAMVAMFGYKDRESMLAIPPAALYVDPQDRLRWSAEMLRTGVVRDFEVRLRRADGKIIWARDTTLAKRQGDGTVVLYEGVIEDITERRSLEAQLSQASKMEAVGQLAGGVAHDFNNLLTVIMSCSAMLLDRIKAGDPGHEDVQEIAAAAELAAGLTRQLLVFSRKQVLQPRVIDINVVIRDVEKMLRRVIGEDIELLTPLHPAIAKINADRGQLEQVLMNLVVNARDAMPEGGRLTINTMNCELSSEFPMGALKAPDGEYVMLAVSDTGMGMTHEVQERLFDPFFTTKEQGRGTGLGLATVYGIIKQSGGEICVYSELGIGTTFKVYFPSLSVAAEEHFDNVKPPAVPRGSETILLVEDDPKLRVLAVRVLKKFGYEVLVAECGDEALAIASNRKTVIDAVVTDVVMPGMNGRELVEKLVASRPGLPCLLMSGYADDEILRRGVSQGDTEFLQKPFTPEQLARKVRAVLDSRNLVAVA